MKEPSLCPCCSGQVYEICCGIFIRGLKLPETPEQLMRSRYTAYTQANIDYIARTMRDKAAIGFNSIEAKQRALTVKWLGLEVIQAQGNFVEFVARFSNQGVQQQIHELSEFKKVGPQWFYVDGKLY